MSQFWLVVRLVRETCACIQCARVEGYIGVLDLSSCFWRDIALIPDLLPTSAIDIRHMGRCCIKLLASDKRLEASR